MRLFNRFIVLLLIPCLLADPALAGLSHRDLPAARAFFVEQALASRPLWIHPPRELVWVYRVVTRWVLLASTVAGLRYMSHHVPQPSLAVSVTAVAVTGIGAIIFRRWLARGWQSFVDWAWKNISKRILRWIHHDRRRKGEAIVTRPQTWEIWRAVKSDRQEVVGLLIVLAMYWLLDWPMLLLAPPYGPFFEFINALIQHNWEGVVKALVLSGVRPLIAFVIARQYGIRNVRKLVSQILIPFTGWLIPVLMILEEDAALGDYLLHSSVRQLLGWLLGMDSLPVTFERRIIFSIETFLVGPVPVLPYIFIAGSLGYILERVGIVSRWYLWIPALAWYAVSVFRGTSKQNAPATTLFRQGYASRTQALREYVHRNMVVRPARGSDLPMVLSLRQRIPPPAAFDPDSKEHFIQDFWASTKNDNRRLLLVVELNGSIIAQAGCWKINSTTVEFSELAVEPWFRKIQLAPTLWDDRLKVVATWTEIQRIEAYVPSELISFVEQRGFQKLEGTAHQYIKRIESPSALALLFHHVFMVPPDLESQQKLLEQMISTSLLLPQWEVKELLLRAVKAANARYLLREIGYHGQITVSGFRVPGGSLLFEVQDNGIGHSASEMSLGFWKQAENNVFVDLVSRQRAAIHIETRAVGEPIGWRADFDWQYARVPRFPPARVLPHLPIGTLYRLNVNPSAVLQEIPKLKYFSTASRAA